MKTFKKGDRVYYDVSMNVPDGPNYQVRGLGTVEDVWRDGEFSIITDLGSKALVELDAGELLVSEEIYNSPLFQAMREEDEL